VVKGVQEVGVAVRGWSELAPGGFTKTTIHKTDANMKITKLKVRPRKGQSTTRFLC
jgi:hypothetical protein